MVEGALAVLRVDVVGRLVQVLLELRLHLLVVGVLFLDPLELLLHLRVLLVGFRPHSLPLIPGSLFDLFNFLLVLPLNEVELRAEVCLHLLNRLLVLFLQLLASINFLACLGEEALQNVVFDLLLSQLFLFGLELLLEGKR